MPCASLGIARRQLLGLPAASFGIEHRPPFADWGTAAQERFAPLSTPYFRSADGVVLAFDLTSRASFERVPSYWTDEIYYKASPDVRTLPPPPFPVRTPSPPRLPPPSLTHTPPYPHPIPTLSPHTPHSPHAMRWALPSCACMTRRVRPLRVRVYASLARVAPPPT